MKAKHFFAVAAVAIVSVIGLCSFTTVGNACNELAEEILQMMLVIATNILISDYWQKTAKKRREFKE